MNNSRHPRRGAHMRRGWMAAGLMGGLVGVVAAAFVARPALAPSWWPWRPAIAELVAAVGAQRIIEPRLTGGFAYAPVVIPSSTRSGVRTDDLQSPDVRIAALRLEK